MLTDDRFDQIFREYYQSMKVYAKRYLIDDDIAVDMVQDVFYNLWKNKDDFIPVGSMKSYLFSAVYYKCLNYIRHEKFTVHSESISEGSPDSINLYYYEQISANPDSSFSNEILLQLKTAISELPDQCRRIFILSRKLGLKNREIAEFLGISIKVVEKQISKALSILHDRINIQ